MSAQVLYQKYKQCGSVSTNTRQIVPGCLFFCLRGDRFNGNAFAGAALSAGAGWVVIDDPAFSHLPNTTLVEDSLQMLQDLARHHRSQLSIPVIGLTGSNGKTTSKELVNAVLSKRYRTLATRGNLNNHIGVPLTVLSITADTEIAIVEMGANHVGEIALLCAIAQPTHGFITNIGKAHIGTFGGYENIVRGKTELFQHLIQIGGTVFINSQNTVFSQMIRRFEKPVLYPAAGDFIHVELIGTDPFLSVRSDGGDAIITHLAGAYNFENIAVALAIGKFFGVDAGAAASAVSEYVPSNMRSQVVRRGSNTVILDAYNANPSSMEAAVRNLQSMRADRKAVILGDMYELGPETEREHEMLGQLVYDCGFELIYFCGPLTTAAAAACPNSKHFQTREELVASLEKEPLADTTVLIKASRGMGLEVLLDHIR